MRTSILGICAALALALALAMSLPAGEDLGAQVQKLTGAHTRLAWIRSTTTRFDDNTLHLYGEPGGYQLLVLDSKEGKERVHQAGPGSFANPIITRDGEKVIWSDTESNTAWIADWGGGGKRKLADGDCAFVLSTHWDAAKKTEWVYAFDGSMVWYKMVRVPEDNRDALGNKKVWRFPLDKGPAAKELVWSKSQINTYWTVSADGKKAASVFPWPKVGIVDLPDGAFKAMSSGEEWGCWANIAPDDSYRFFFFQGNHKKINMFDPGKTSFREIDVTSMPGNGGARDSVAPRFANHARFLCIGSPLAFDAQHAGDVYLGRFDAGWTKVEEWVQISSHPNRDVMLSAWLANGVTSKAAGAKK